MVCWFSVSFDSTDESIVVLETNDTYTSRAAAFGPRTEEPITLSLVAVETLDPTEERTGCRPVVYNSSYSVDDKPWAALVERGGNCGFVDKVKNMMISGASAVIVGDCQKGPLVTMYSNRDDTSDINIPSVFISQTHYRELRYLGMEFGQGFLIKMARKDDELPILDAVIILIVSPLVVFPFLFFLWRMRLRQLRLADLAPPEVVNSLPIKIFFKSKLKENDPVECVICLDEFADEDELRVLPCRHEYHAACVDNWLITRKKFCPICKRDICLKESAPSTPVETPTERTPLLGSSTPRMETDSRVIIPFSTSSTNNSSIPSSSNTGDSSTSPCDSYSTALSSGSSPKSQEPQSTSLGRVGEVTIPVEPEAPAATVGTESSSVTESTSGERTDHNGSSSSDNNDLV
ncbi:hypothetical protein FBU30_003951 [Linnemannia zychae]|nr:hypothetical protein FBU30_003951 [Linnemannia zychae]